MLAWCWRDRPLGSKGSDPWLQWLWGLYWWVQVHWGKDKGNPAETLMLEEPTALGGLTLHATTHPCLGRHGGGKNADVER